MKDNLLFLDIEDLISLVFQMAGQEGLIYRFKYNTSKLKHCFVQVLRTNPILTIEIKKEGGLFIPIRDIDYLSDKYKYILQNLISKIFYTDDFYLISNNKTKITFIVKPFSDYGGFNFKYSRMNYDLFTQKRYIYNYFKIIKAINLINNIVDEVL